MISYDLKFFKETNTQSLKYGFHFQFFLLISRKMGRLKNVNLRSKMTSLLGQRV